MEMLMAEYLNIFNIYRHSCVKLYQNWVEPELLWRVVRTNWTATRSAESLKTLDLETKNVKAPTDRR